MGSGGKVMFWMDEKEEMKEDGDGAVFIFFS